MTLSLTIAQQAGYWLAGVLTVVAAAIVTISILISSRSGPNGG